MSARVAARVARVATERRPRRAILLTAIVATVALALVGLPVVSQLVPARDDFNDPGSESGHVESALRHAGRDVPGGVGALVRAPHGAPVASAAGVARVRSVSGALRGDRGVARVTSMLAPTGRGLIAKDERSTYVVATLRHESASATRRTVHRIERRLGHRAGVDLGGAQVAYDQAGKQTEHDLRQGELVALPLLAIAALLVFRGAVAALLPLAIGLVSALLTLTAMRVENSFVQLSSFALNLVTALSLGLAIDYSLFVVSRFREELGDGDDRRAALERTLATAGRTIAISALTVSAALASMFVFPERFLRSMGLCGATVALSALVATLAVLPAALGALGPRVNALSPRRWREALRREGRTGSGPWHWLATRVTRRPGIVALVTAAAMLGLAVPAVGAHFVQFDAGKLPPGTSSRRVADALRRDFAAHGSPVTVIAHARDSQRPAVRAFADRLTRIDGVAGVNPPELIGHRRWYLEAQLRPSDNSPAAKRVVRRIRHRHAPFAVDVGGETATAIDKSASLRAGLPLALALLSATTFALVLALTRSVVLPLKTLLINALTLASTFGLLTLIFQHGFLKGVLGVEHQDGLDASQPVLLCALAFALTTDYGIFLLARIAEAHARGADSAAAAAEGLRRTGRIVTAAALLFCIAVGVLATSPLDFVKLLGIGTTAAVILDATVVRGLLVPSLVSLLGRANWWLPGRGAPRTGERPAAGARMSRIARREAGRAA